MDYPIILFMESLKIIIETFGLVQIKVYQNSILKKAFLKIIIKQMDYRLMSLINGLVIRVKAVNYTLAE
jgi:hypothetical protein